MVVEGKHSLISSLSLFALSYGLERHAARCPRTFNFLNPDGYFYSGAASLEAGGADSVCLSGSHLNPVEIKISAAHPRPDSGPAPRPRATASKECRQLGAAPVGGGRRS